MRKYSPFLFLSAILLIVATACNTVYAPQSLQHQSYRISDTQQKDQAVVAFLEPYSETVHKTMNTVIGTAVKTLEKKQPESTLGNFMVDAFFDMAKEKYDT